MSGVLQWGATSAHGKVGLLAAIIDNIPILFAVLTVNLNTSVGQ
jgi:hypothetical protein